VTSFGYDTVSRLNLLSHDLAGTSGDLTLGFGFNPASQIASVSRSNDDYVWTGSYNVTRPYAVNGLNQYTAAGSASFTYDANSNPTSDGTTSFTYDVENRLVAAAAQSPQGCAMIRSGGSMRRRRYAIVELTRLLKDRLAKSRPTPTHPALASRHSMTAPPP
jgi:hypothetical protein